MGLETDPQRSSLWVDMYGLITRDLEPSKEGGDKLWKVFQSCMRVFRSGAATCTATASAAAESCCDRTVDPRLRWKSVWSLSLADATVANTNATASAARPAVAAALGAPLAPTASGVRDNLLTVDANERAVLVGEGWTELCAPLGGASQFCAAHSPAASVWEQGPFLIYAGPLLPPTPSDSTDNAAATAATATAASGSATDAANGTSIAIHRCIDATSRRWID
jgi:hypothetical protein